MPALAAGLPTRRPELVVRQLGDRGRYVVKDPRTGEYFTLGEQEHFLLTQLDGRNSAEGICAAFAEHFGEPLSEQDLDDFVEMARGKDFLQSAEAHDGVARPEQSHVCRVAAASEARPSKTQGVPRSQRKSRQSILYWRKSVFDPDRPFTWLAPKLWFFWTSTFLFLSVASISFAVGLVLLNRQELVSSFAQAWRWETLVLVWLTLLLTTTCHEFAHGLTCKHYGGEVHEVGFLLLFFMPCFYFNVPHACPFPHN